MWHELAKFRSKMRELVKNYDPPRGVNKVIVYCRVDQPGDGNKFHTLQINNAGFDVFRNDSHIEVTSAATLAKDRVLLMQIMDEMKAADVFFVPNLSSLGADASDILGTIRKLRKKSVVLFCLEIGWADLAGEIGVLIVRAIVSGCQLERELQAHRIKVGIRSAEEAGKKVGRPCVLADSQIKHIQKRIAAGETLASIARSMNVSWTTISRIKNASR